MPASRLTLLAIVLSSCALAACGAGPATQLPKDCTRFESADGRAIYLCDEDTSAPRIELETAAPRIETGPPVQGLSYRFVLVMDTSPTGSSPDAGADLDAVLLHKANGAVHYAHRVEAFANGSGFEREVDAEDALGEPNAFSDWESDHPVCELSEGLVSLGGSGGLLVVGFDVDIEPGDALTVLEAGGCTGNAGAEGIPGSIEVAISVGNEVNGSWIFVTSGEGPRINAVVPPVPRN